MVEKHTESQRKDQRNSVDRTRAEHTATKAFLQVPAFTDGIPVLIPSGTTKIPISLTIYHPFRFFNYNPAFDITHDLPKTFLLIDKIEKVTSLWLVLLAQGSRDNWNFLNEEEPFWTRPKFILKV